MSKRDDILRKINALLAKAAATDFEEEARIFQQKADSLMLQWAIEEADLAAADPSNQKYKPEIRTINLEDYGRYQNHFLYLLRAIGNHARCKLPEYGWNRIVLIGYPGDLDYVEVLFAKLGIHMATTINPKPDPAASEAENLYNLKMAGYSWEDIWFMMRPGEPWDRNKATRWSGVVKKYAEANGLPRNMTGGRKGLQNYRDQFVNAYVHQIEQRLKGIEEAREETMRGKGLVLASRLDDLTEFMYERYPNLRPHPADCECENCHVRKCRDPKCQRPRCVSARKPIRRSSASIGTYHEAAWSHGRRAANSADLGQTGVGTKKELG